MTKVTCTDFAAYFSPKTAPVRIPGCGARRHPLVVMHRRPQQGVDELSEFDPQSHRNGWHGRHSALVL